MLSVTAIFPLNYLAVVEFPFFLHLLLAPVSHCHESWKIGKGFVSHKLHFLGTRSSYMMNMNEDYAYYITNCKGSTCSLLTVKLENEYYLGLEVGEGGVTRKYTVVQRSASPPTEATAEVSRPKVKAAGCQRYPPHQKFWNWKKFAFNSKNKQKKDLDCYEEGRKRRGMAEVRFGLLWKRKKQDGIWTK